jgi:transposase-like protein
VRLFPVENRNAATLLGLIGENIHAESTIVSDGWRAYGGIKLMKQQYTHQFVNHNMHFVDPADPNVHTQGIEGTWSAIKRSMRHLQGTSRDLFPTYLFQYMFRRFHGNTKIFQHLLEEIRIQYPL